MDPAGHRLTVAELSGRTVSYAYDNIYRLNSETISGAGAGPSGAVGYTYDPVANRAALSSALPAIIPGTFTYDADDRMAGDSYDANGNTVSSGGIANVYDFENRLIQRGGVSITYDGDGNRVSKAIGSITTKYLVDDHNPTGFPQVLEESVSDGSTRSFTYGINRISQKQLLTGGKTTTTTFYIYDGHGSVRALTDASGAVTDNYDYDAFGNLIRATGATPNEFRFAGEQFDPDLGLYYLRARYYNPATGRFWTMDQHGSGGETTQSLNQYLYGSADPVNRIDPSGNQDVISEAFSDAIAGELASRGTSFVLQSPLGSSVLGWLLSHFMPANYFNTILTGRFNAGMVGATVGASFGTGLVEGGLVGGFGVEALVSLRQIAAYGYLAGGIAFGEANTSGSVAGYFGPIFNISNSSEYSGLSFGVSVPEAALPKNVEVALNRDSQIIAMAIAGAGRQIQSAFPGLGSTLQSLGKSPVHLDGAVNLFTDPAKNGNGPSGYAYQLGHEFTYSKRSEGNLALSLAIYFQIYPGEPCYGEEGCEAQAVKF
jgi:RHS repeat-associated protein